MIVELYERIKKEQSVNRNVLCEILREVGLEDNLTPSVLSDVVKSIAPAAEEELYVTFHEDRDCCALRLWYGKPKFEGGNHPDLTLNRHDPNGALCLVNVQEKYVKDYYSPAYCLNDIATCNGLTFLEPHENLGKHSKHTTGGVNRESYIAKVKKVVDNNTSEAEK